MFKVVAQDLFAGSCGGASGILAGYPFDTVKTLIQNQTLPVKYKSTFQAIGLVAKEVRNFYVFNTQYMTNSTLVSPVKMEYG